MSSLLKKMMNIESQSIHRVLANPDGPRYSPLVPALSPSLPYSSSPFAMKFELHGRERLLVQVSSLEHQLTNRFLDQMMSFERFLE